MPKRIDGDAGRKVEVCPILGVVDNAALAVGEDDGRPGVGREEALGLLLQERRHVGRCRLIRVRRLQVALIGLEARTRQGQRGSGRVRSAALARSSRAAEAATKGGGGGSPRGRRRSGRSAPRVQPGRQHGRRKRPSGACWGVCKELKCRGSEWEGKVKAARLTRPRPKSSPGGKLRCSCATSTSGLCFLS